MLEVRYLRHCFDDEKLLDARSSRDSRDVGHSTGAAQGVSLRFMETHAFKDAADPTKGGTWSGDYGIRICTWAWSHSTKVLEVRCGPRGKSRDLSSIDMSTVDLRRRLPEIALQMAALLAQST